MPRYCIAFYNEPAILHASYTVVPHLNTYAKPEIREDLFARVFSRRFVLFRTARESHLQQIINVMSITNAHYGTHDGKPANPFIIYEYSGIKWWWEYSFCRLEFVENNLLIRTAPVKISSCLGDMLFDTFKNFFCYMSPRKYTVSCVEKMKFTVILSAKSTCHSSQIRHFDCGS